MTRNVSAVVDDDIYNFIEEIRKEQGVLKSKSINNLLKEMMLQRKSQSTTQHVKPPETSTPLQPPPFATLIGSQQQTPPAIPNTLSTSTISAPIQSNPIISSPPFISASIPTSQQDVKADTVKTEVKTEVKTDKSVPDKSTNKPVNKPAIKPDKPGRRYEAYNPLKKFFNFNNFNQMEVNKRMTTTTQEEEPISERERYKKFREEEENERKMRDLYERVKNTHLRVCEDGDCFRKELSGIKKDVEEIKESRKVDQELVEVRKGLDDLKKNVTRMEVCPECGEKSIVHMSSYCSNCGSKVNEWTDDTGSKIASWKPYWERIRKV